MNGILTDSPFHKNWRFFGPSELCAPYLYWVEIFALTWYLVTIKKWQQQHIKLFLLTDQWISLPLTHLMHCCGLLWHCRTNPVIIMVLTLVVGLTLTPSVTIWTIVNKYLYLPNIWMMMTAVEHHQLAVNSNDRLLIPILLDYWKCKQEKRGMILDRMNTHNTTSSVQYLSRRRGVQRRKEHQNQREWLVFSNLTVDPF